MNGRSLENENYEENDFRKWADSLLADQQKIHEESLNKTIEMFKKLQQQLREIQ